MHKRLFSTKMLPLLVVIAISLFLLLGLLPHALTIEAEEPQFQQAPMRLEPMEKPPILNGHGTGYIPPPMDLSHLTGQTMPDVP